MIERKEIKKEYFEWLCKQVCNATTSDYISHRQVCDHLHQREFTVIIPNDINRGIDGFDLRYRFASRYGFESDVDVLDGPCSVLEMMVALAIRIEETIMSNTEYGDRTSQWFWIMMTNLGLSCMNDEEYDSEIVDEVIDVFLNREYEYDGKGGLFYIRDTDEDLRQLEIWVQTCWFLDNFE